MANARWSRLRNLFEQARELTGEERSALLDRELADDAVLRAELDSLLKAGDDASHFLVDHAALGTGSSIGPYHLIEPIGEGGFGVVYLAEQQRPIKRRVALKLIKPGMDSRQVIARFEAERQALALMDHPGIAQVFDAGETPEGRPYFAMEHVAGVPITVFCDQEKLSLRERLEVFLLACDAIRHAHQKGVIHRDIKPSNVMVARRDGSPALKVIDFGIAKATGENSPGGPTMTREGMIIGTTGYMSPEQLGATNAPVDTRSDIYSLGVLLYELLAGDLPYDREQLKRASWLDAMQIILGDPTPPAVRAARTDTAEVAVKRSTDARSLVKSLRGELEWITLKALEKEPERRYASASELANDIRHFLADEPVSAAAPGTMYRIGKYARRHRVGVTAAALILLAIVAGGIAATVGFGRAVKAERLAKREAESSAQVADFLVGLFHKSSPGAGGDTMTVRSLLDEGVRKIEMDPPDDPHVRARLFGAMSDSYLNLGQYDEGVRLTRAALAAIESAKPRDDVEVARYLDKVANGLSMAGEEESLLVVVERTIALLSANRTGDPDLLSWCLYRKARYRLNHGGVEEADSLIDLAIATAKSVPAPDNERLARMYGTKGLAASWRYDFASAITSYRTGLECARRAGEPMRIAAMEQAIAGAFEGQGEGDSSLAHAEAGVAIARRVYAPDHPALAGALGAQTGALSSLGRYPEAIALQEEVVRILRGRGKPGEQLAYELAILGSYLQMDGKLEEAIERTREAVDLYESDLGPMHFRVGETKANLARYEMEIGRMDAAEAHFRQTIEIGTAIDDKTIVLPIARQDFGNLCIDLGRLAEAESLFARSSAGLDSTNNALRAYYGNNIIGLARIWARQGRVAEAESLMAHGVRLRLEDVPEADPSLVDLWLCLAEVRWMTGHPEEAIESLRRAGKSGAASADVARYPELAALRSRADYPLDNSP
ncbi:MAG TPA: tetratricopeptide repeat protein [Candidatus Eisenbacteria bacterium]